MILLFLFAGVYIIDSIFNFLGIVKFLLPIPLYFIIAFLLEKFLKITICDPNDYLMSWHQDNNICSIVGCSILDKTPTDFVSLIGRMERKILSCKQFTKLRQILYRGPLCGYWKISGNYKFSNHYLVSDDHIDSYEKLYEFMGEQISSVKFPEGRPAWRLFFFTKFTETPNSCPKMAIVIKVHHSIADGISLMSGLFHLLECKEYQTIKLPKITALQKFLFYIPAFIKMPYNMMTWYKFKKDKNFFHTGEVLGRKNVHCSKPFPLNKIKSYANARKITVNDLLTAILLKSLEVYAPEGNKGKMLEEVLMLVPFSLRPLPKAGEIYNLNNRVTGINVKFVLKPEAKVDFYANQSAALLGKIRKSNDIFVVSVLTDFLISFFPRPLYEIIFREGVNLPSCVFTNVPGPVDQVAIAGDSKVEKVFFFVNMLSDTVVFLTVISYNDSVIFSCSSDISVPFDPKIFIKCVEEISSSILIE